MMDLQGQFLIAMPQLEDYFQNTVVYMCEHNEQGSMGCICVSIMSKVRWA